MKHIIIISFALFLLITNLAHAQTATKQTPIQVLQSATDEIMKTLDKNQIRQFEAIRTAHGTIRGVQDVRGLLTRATKACVQKNPDIAEAVTTRFTSWTDAVDPVIRQGQNRLDKMVLLQNYAKPSQVRNYLRTFDRAVEWRTSQLQTVPVSDKEGCERMVKSMDRTQADLTALLTKTLKLDQQLIIEPKK